MKDPEAKEVAQALAQQREALIEAAVYAASRVGKAIASEWSTEQGGHEAGQAPERTQEMGPQERSAGSELDVARGQQPGGEQPEAGQSGSGQPGVGQQTQVQDPLTVIQGEQDWMPGNQGPGYGVQTGELTQLDEDNELEVGE